MENKCKPFFSKVLTSEVFVALLLIYLLALEWFTLRYSNYDGHKCLTYWDSKYPYMIMLGWAILGSILAVGFSLGVYKISKYIIKRFITNALGLRWLSFVFVMGFLVHISWLSDVLWGLIVRDQRNFIEVGTVLVGMIVLFTIFPKRTRNKRKEIDYEGEKLLITGISAPINENSLEGFCKPFNKTENDGYSNIKDVIVLLSNAFFTRPSEEQLPTFEKIVNKIKPELEEMKIDPESFCEKFKSAIIEHNQKEIKFILKSVIIASIKTFHPNYKDKQINIYFSEDFYNYNDFETCYNVLGDLIKKYERKLSDDTTSNTLIHISPGTALISSCMSLYAIKGNRTLLYTTQDVKVTRSFDYDIFTTEELLNELWKEYDN